MTQKYPCYLEFSDNGKFCRIVAKSQIVVAELILDDTYMANRARAAWDYLKLQNIPRPEQPYKGLCNTVTENDVIEEMQLLQDMLDGLADFEGVKIQSLTGEN